MREYALVLLITAAVTYLLVPLVRRFAIASGAMPELRARDVHKEPTPRLGGLAMFGGLVAGLVVASRLTNLQDPFQAAGSKTQSGLLLAGGLIVVIGFIDDRWGLGAVSKLAGQVAAAGILVWSGQALPWLPEPNGHELSLTPDLSVTLTILLIVVTINAINFIDGMDGLAAGIVAVTAIGFLVYSYSLVQTLKVPSQSLPAVSSALLAGMCIGFLPHNFYPARIFMGDTGAMLLGLLLAYGPISSTGSLDDAVLVNYAQNHPFNRFATFLPLLVPAAIFLIPYTDLMLAVIRRTRRGIPLMAADREHLHHRLMNVGHSYRQSVLIMWLWAALLSATVVALSLVRTHLWVLAVATFAAVLLLLPVTMPSLRPWHASARSAAGADTPVSQPSAGQLPAAASAASVSAGAGAGASSAAARVRGSSGISGGPVGALAGPGASAGPAGWQAEPDRARVAPASAFAAVPVSGHRAEPAGPQEGFGGSSVDGFGRGPADSFGGAAVGGAPVGAFGGPARGTGAVPGGQEVPARPNGMRSRRGAAHGGPPPGFEPVPAPPGADSTRASRFWSDGHSNGSLPINGGLPSSGFPGNGGFPGGDSLPGGEVLAGSGDSPFRQFADDAESGLRPFPGDINDGPFPPPDTAPFPSTPQFPGPRAFPEPLQSPEASQLPGQAAFADDGRLADDTEQFPTTPHGDPR